jgi:[ribosomal protein S18]-alanine N-acetyltransferase
MTIKSLEFKSLTPSMTDELAEFFEQIVTSGDNHMFHPHPFDRQTASAISHREGLDQYVVALVDGDIVAYGMLRGWDDGYEVPSLGMIVHPASRGIGMGVCLITYLHTLALICGSERTRLSVYACNESAISLYKKVGYTFTPTEDGRLIGVWQPNRRSR